LKEIKVNFSAEFNTEYNLLLSEVKKEKTNNIKNSLNFQLLKTLANHNKI